MQIAPKPSYAHKKMGPEGEAYKILSCLCAGRLGGKSAVGYKCGTSEDSEMK